MDVPCLSVMKALLNACVCACVWCVHACVRVCVCVRPCTRVCGGVRACVYLGFVYVRIFSHAYTSTLLNTTRKYQNILQIYELQDKKDLPVGNVVEWDVHTDSHTVVIHQWVSVLFCYAYGRVSVFSGVCELLRTLFN